MEWTKKGLAKELGERISGKIICPECSSSPNLLDQRLSAVGDMENVIFCPHCDMQFKIVVETLPYPEAKLR